MPKTELLSGSKSKHLTETQKGQEAFVSNLVIKYAYSQLKLHKDTAKKCGFNIICHQQEPKIENWTLLFN